MTVTDEHIGKMIRSMRITGAPMAATEIEASAGDFWLVVMTPAAFKQMQSMMVLDPRTNPDDLVDKS